MVRGLQLACCLSRTDIPPLKAIHTNRISAHEALQLLLHARERGRSAARPFGKRGRSGARLGGAHLRDRRGLAAAGINKERPAAFAPVRAQQHQVLQPQQLQAAAGGRHANRRQRATCAPPAGRGAASCHVGSAIK
jgi:hypothetical protein